MLLGLPVGAATTTPILVLKYVSHKRLTTSEIFTICSLATTACTNYIMPSTVHNERLSRFKLLRTQTNTTQANCTLENERLGHYRLFAEEIVWR
jgi:hypothetical protein